MFPNWKNFFQSWYCEDQETKNMGSKLPVKTLQLGYVWRICAYNNNHFEQMFWRFH